MKKFLKHAILASVCAAGIAGLGAPDAKAANIHDTYYCLGFDVPGFTDSSFVRPAREKTDASYVYVKGHKADNARKWYATAYVNPKKFSSDDPRTYVSAMLPGKKGVPIYPNGADHFIANNAYERFGNSQVTIRGFKDEIYSKYNVWFWWSPDSI
ncbi:putative membrane protein [Paenibacillus larvae subsp. larvae]|uniref:Putative membrane protein n=2 Tax=Paenibacillus larvae TaxID=1464 RepID=A0A2L1U111_9BACL|nr:hypothetical protein [Paenibacillus larvae]AQT83395.1 hypothetical protein B1222_01375 [Paenibacillus larvae subsp. pulvifaciens]AQZ48499.1 hypothetical protein B5S25_19825 [Paenibacillus larvae subsp. pulvifaciens]AVF26558.1 putative membrane protein [Paenibacillus larvae subsp. larvae]AVF31290.1 putative membrane protein [Paenibacillus larvae subsp. larvae]MBH0342171.1 hypothetical protein [Paenibacillus larvae]